MKYLDLLKAQGTEKEQLKQFTYQAAKTKLQLESSILETQSAIEEVKQQLELTKAAYPLNPQELADQANKLEKFERGLKFMQGLLAELF